MGVDTDKSEFGDVCMDWPISSLF